MASISVIVATYGDLVWEQLGYERAIPSAKAQWGNGDSLVAVHLPEGTLAEARNTGAADASGDWLCFLDADDELAPGYLDAMRGAMAKWMLGSLASPPDQGVRALLLAPALQYIEKSGRELPPALPNRGLPMDTLNHCVIGTLVPRDLFLEVGGFREMAALEDWELWLRCIRAGASIVDVPDAVYRAHMRDGSRNLDQSLYDQIRNEHLGAIT